MTADSHADPPVDELADERDVLDWDRAVHGRMLAAATPGDTVATVPFVLDEDLR